MKIFFENLDEQYKSGMCDFLKWHSIQNEEGGLTVRISVKGNGKIKITKEDNSVLFELDRPYQVFRAVTLLKQRKEQKSFCIEESCFFDMCGAMFDGSQASSLMNIESCKKMMLILAGMGFNMMMLYCEDCFTVPGEAYWGNMRPRYTEEEFRTLDDYAYSLGIEMIPCIQTLGHLTEAIKRPPYKKIADTDAVLMVGEEEVYLLLDKIIGYISSCFRSRKIHLGLDEAWDLGLGNYLKKNGYSSQAELMGIHIKKVHEIVEQYNLLPLMWSDMFFRTKSKTADYFNYTISFTEEDREKVPGNMSLIYWDYYSMEEKQCESMIRLHRQLTDKIIFAGCSRNVSTFGSHHKKTVVTTNAALLACKNLGVRDVFATIWGDDHRESSTFAILPGLQLYAEHMYCENPSEDTVSQRFEACVCAEYKDFVDIDRFDRVPEYNGDNIENATLSKACMWQDILLGLCDEDLRNVDFSQHYGKLKLDMQNDAKRYPEFRLMFEFYYHVANVLETKSYIGIRITDAYRKRNKAELQNIKDNVLPRLYDDMASLRIAHRNYFFGEYKPIGWEVLDIRYGGALMRIDTAIARLDDYLSGNAAKLDELEEERLSFSGENKIMHPIRYASVCSASRL
jgi:hypothetical protein